MKLTNTAAAAIRVMAHLAGQENGEAVRSARALHAACSLAMPVGARYRNLQFILHRLTRDSADLLLSSSGRNGGYGLARPASEISLLEIVRACGARGDSEALAAVKLSDLVKEAPPS